MDYFPSRKSKNVIMVFWLAKRNARWNIIKDSSSLMLEHYMREYFALRVMRNDVRDYPEWDLLEVNQNKPIWQIPTSFPELGRVFL